MKKLLLAAAFLFGVTLAFTSCNNGAYDANPNTDLSNTGNPLDVPGGAYYMTCDVDGENYAGYGAFFGTTSLGITATSVGALSNNAGEYQLNISVFDYSIPKTYTQPDNNIAIVFGKASDPGNAFTDVDNSAIVTITEVADTYINGTFSGRLKSNGAYKTIANGRFHVKKI